MSSLPVVPLFPLPNVLLYPDAMLPLHVFEPRFVRLVEDLARSGDDRIVLALLQPGWEPAYFERPPVYQVAGLGRMLSSSRAGVGRYNILVRGLQRVRVIEEPSEESPYRLARIAELHEVPPRVAPEVEELRLALRDGLIEFAEGSLLLHNTSPLSYLADVLIVALPLDVAYKQELFSILDVEERARQVLECLRDINGRRRRMKAAGKHPDKTPLN